MENFNNITVHSLYNFERFLGKDLFDDHTYP